MMNISSKNVNRPVTVLPVQENGAGATTLVGNVISYVAGISVTDATIHTVINAVTDITDPAGTGGWTTIETFSSDVPFLAEISHNTLGELAIRVDAAEVSGKALRIQILVDGVIVADGYVIADNASTMDFAMRSAFGEDAGSAFPIQCNSSFVIKAAREGDLTSAAFYMGELTFRSL